MKIGAIPFFGFDPGVKIRGTYRSLDLEVYPFLAFDPGVKMGVPPYRSPDLEVYPFLALTPE